ncbi:MAG: hypothetical protein RDV48_19085 [Candidatus Eremiobacteraeota bacterium]|nr:hypothetical protein [Candidatus Eremiobacteraeota bacterium]
MKRKITMLAIAAALLLTGISYAADFPSQDSTGPEIMAGAPQKPQGKAILIEVKIASEVEGHSIVLSPKIITVENKLATIKVGDQKAELNDRPVKTDREAKPSQKSFLMVLQVTPQVVENITPPLIKMDIKFSLTHGSFSTEQSFQTVVQNGDSFHYESSDRTKNQKLGLMIKASVAGDKGGAPREGEK